VLKLALRYVGQMNPVAARSAAERYVAELIGGCQAIASLFEEVDLPRASGDDDAKEMESVGCESMGGLCLEDSIREDQEIAAVKRHLSTSDLDPDRLAAWLEGADLPSGLQKSQSPFMAFITRSPGAQHQSSMSSGGRFLLDATAFGSTTSPSKPDHPIRSLAEADTSANSSPGQDWGPPAVGTCFCQPDFESDGCGDGGLQDALLATGPPSSEDWAHGDKPTLKGQHRESEIHRLRRLVDPRYRRQPAPPKDASKRERPLSSHRATPSRAMANSSALVSEALQEPKGSPKPPPRRPNSGKRFNRSQGVAQVAPASEKLHVRPSSPPSQGRSQRSKTGPAVKRQATAPGFKKLQLPLAQIKAAPLSKSKVLMAQLLAPQSDKAKVGLGRRSVALPSMASMVDLQKRLLAEDEEDEEDLHGMGFLKDDLRNLLHKQSHGQNTTREMLDHSVDIYELHQMAAEHSMTMDDIALVKKVFDSFDVDQNGNLDIDEFEQAVTKLLRMQVSEDLTAERLQSLCEWFWMDSDQDKSGCIDFREFLGWYSSNSFNADLLLTEGQRDLRKIAKTHGVSPDYVEKMKKSFDLCDTDGSGEVDIDEFEIILNKCMKVPAHYDIPPSRVSYFWTQVDTDHSGRITFAEFFAWWMKTFGEHQSSTETPLDAYYKQVRRMGAKHLDPPAYPPSASTVAATQCETDAPEDFFAVSFVGSC